MGWSGKRETDWLRRRGEWRSGHISSESRLQEHSSSWEFHPFCVEEIEVMAQGCWGRILTTSAGLKYLGLTRTLTIPVSCSFPTSDSPDPSQLQIKKGREREERSMLQNGNNLNEDKKWKGRIFQFALQRAVKNEKRGGAWKDGSISVVSYWYVIETFDIGDNPFLCLFDTSHTSTPSCPFISPPLHTSNPPPKIYSPRTRVVVLSPSTGFFAIGVNFSTKRFKKIVKLGWINWNTR